jgi:AcrR family transcriptional regulator
VLDGLEQIILADGFRNLAVSDIAARLGCSRRTLYELAPTKDELVLIAIDCVYQRIGHKAQQQLRRIEDPIERVCAFVGAAIAALSSASLDFVEDVESHAGARSVVDAHVRFALACLMDVIEEGISRGTFRAVNVAVAARVFQAAVASTMRPEVLMAVQLSEAEALNELTELILRGLIADSGSSSSERPRASTQRPSGSRSSVRTTANDRRR